MNDLTIEVRIATDNDRRNLEISGTDNAAVIEVDGEPVAWCDDYMTAHLVAGTDVTPTGEQVEALMMAVSDFWEGLTRE